MKTVLVLGTFDGVHTAHRALVKKACTLGERVVVCSFETLPSLVLNGTGQMLTDGASKQKLLRSCGADEVFLQKFDDALAATEPEAYIHGLVERFHPSAVVTGFDHRFGKAGRGNNGLLSELGKREGFSLTVMPPVLWQGEVVSSTAIRRALAEGDLYRANGMLGRPFSLSGITVHGRELGRQIGFPTVNTQTAPGLLIPAAGVYATRVRAAGRLFKGMTNIGVNPTVGEGNPLTVETYLFGFAGDLYGKTTTVEFCSYVRPDRKFDSVEALKQQLRQDALLINGYLDTVKTDRG